MEATLGFEPIDPSLTPSTIIHDFGAVEAAAAAQSFTWVVTNRSDVPTAALDLRNSNPSSFQTQTNCAESLVPGASCSVEVSFLPETTGDFSGVIELVADSRRVELSVVGKGRWRLTVHRNGRGDITSFPEGIACELDTCSGLFAPGAVQLEARTTNGAASFFAQWSPGDCQASQVCTFELDQSRDVIAHFMTLSNNLIFISSARFPPNLGGVAAYDAECNRLASAAGINTATADGFIAAMSDSQSSLRQRLGVAQGWIRMDGFPFVDTTVNLFDNRHLIAAPAFDERGALTPAPEDALRGDLALNVYSGTASDGSSVTFNCNDWTATGSDIFFELGRASGGPTVWLSAFAGPCDATAVQRVYCMGVSSSSPIVNLSPYPSLPVSGKRFWVTTPYLPGSMSPDQKCKSELPPGVADGLAFVAYTDRPAAAVLDPSAFYFRPDGALIGAGADLARLRVLAGPWVLADGTVASHREQNYVQIGPQPADGCLYWSHRSWRSRHR